MEGYRCDKCGKFVESWQKIISVLMGVDDYETHYCSRACLVDSLIEPWDLKRAFEKFMPETVEKYVAEWRVSGKM